MKPSNEMEFIEFLSQHRLVVAFRRERLQSGEERVVLVLQTHEGLPVFTGFTAGGKHNLRPVEVPWVRGMTRSLRRLADAIAEPVQLYYARMSDLSEFGRANVHHAMSYGRVELSQVPLWRTPVAPSPKG